MFAAKKVFKYLCTEMKPAAKELDGSKWTKFAKSLPDVIDGKRILQQNSLAQHWARDWRALALTQVHHGSRLSDSCEGGEALSSVHPPTPATGKLIHDLLCDGRVKND